MIDDIIDLLERLPKGLSGSERESLRAQLLRIMTVQSSSSNAYMPADVGTDSDKLDGQHGSYYQNATNINAGTLSTDRYSAYADLGAESKIGAGATQVAAGDHQTHNVEQLVNVSSSSPANGDILQLTDWLEVSGGLESLYDSAILVTNGNGNYANAWDKNYSNYWRADPPPNWTTAAFPRKVFLSKVIIDQTVMGWPLNGIGSCAIYGSHTGAFGGEENLIINATGLSGTRKTITIAEPRTGYRYYKLDFGSSPYNADITEIELYTAEDKPKWENRTLAGAGIATSGDLTAHTSDTSNPHGVTKAQVGLGNVANTLHKRNATAAPTVNDDAGDGYSIGSEWTVVTTDQTYQCQDATVGAAVWKEITATSATDADAIHDNVSGEIATIAGKTTPADADVTIIEDSAAGNAKKRLSWASVKAALKIYFDSLYATLTHNHDTSYAPIAKGVTNGDSHDHNGGDGAQISHTALGSIGIYSHTQIDTALAKGQWTYLTIPLISTSWDGDSHSTTGKTLIDLSAVFGAPAGIKAVLLWVAVRDSASATVETYLILGPTSSNFVGMAADPHPINDRVQRETIVVPCDANGDIYYQIGASGAGTFDVWMQIWGYLL